MNEKNLRLLNERVDRWKKEPAPDADQILTVLGGLLAFTEVLLEQSIEFVTELFEARATYDKYRQGFSTRLAKDGEWYGDWLCKHADWERLEYLDQGHAHFRPPNWGPGNKSWESLHEWKGANELFNT